MSTFEIVMLICFGLAWPASIYKSYTARKNGGKSLIFLFIILSGYGAGILHKIFYNYDAVIWLYITNAFMVLIDIGLYFRNSYLQKPFSLKAI